MFGFSQITRRLVLLGECVWTGLLLCSGVAWGESPAPLATAPIGSLLPSVAPDKTDVMDLNLPSDVSPPSEEALRDSMRGGIDFLLKNQSESGAWGDHTQFRHNSVLCPIPQGPLAFRTACTALCILGLLETPMRDDPRVRAAIARATDYLIINTPRLRVMGPDRITYYAVWGAAYTVEACAKLAKDMDKASPEYAKLKACTQTQLELLYKMTDTQGGWGYVLLGTIPTVTPTGLPTSFTTATVLIAMKQAQTVFGMQLNPRVANHSLQFLFRQRLPTGTYLYAGFHWFRPSGYINRYLGSLARSPACDLTLMLWKKDSVSTPQLEGALNRLWRRYVWLTMSLKKPKPHESFAANSGYFFYYGLYYAAMCIPHTPAHTHAWHARHLSHIVINHQEGDGSWWDYPLYNYHKFYGTGYALYALGTAHSLLYPKNTK